MARGNYTFEQIQQMDTMQIYFLHHYQEVVKNEEQGYLASALGIIWDKEILTEKLTSSSKPLEKLFIPLSVAINPDILDYVKKQFNMSSSKKSSGPAYIGGGDYMPKSNEVINSLGDMSKDDFMRMIGKRR